MALFTRRQTPAVTPAPQPWQPPAPYRRPPSGDSREPPRSSRPHSPRRSQPSSCTRSRSAHSTPTSTSSPTPSCSDTPPDSSNCDIDLRWYVSNPQAGGDLFAIDVYEGVSSDFIQVRTLQSNRTGADRRCTFYFRDDNWHSANLVIIQKPYVEPPPPPPEPDPDWDLDVPGNWILSRSYSDPADSSVFHDDITFYDGLGYPVQTVLVGASPAPARRPGEAVIQTGRNIVRPVVYDSMRRPDAVSYLPYPAARSGRERETDPLAAQAAWYESAYPGEGDFAFSSTSYEPSPLSRVTATRRPGADYAEDSPSGDRPATVSYSANRPGEALALPGIQGRLSDFARNIRDTLLL